MTRRDVVVVGGGHNGLVAAILAAKAGRSVVVLERSDHVGGASVGAQVFSGHPARLSRYSYLISLFPDDVAQAVGIDLPLASRTVSSYTPVLRAGRAGGLLVERQPGPATEASFAEVTGSGQEWLAWQQLYGELSQMAAVLAPRLTGPLLRRSEVRDLVIGAAGSQLWEDLFENPISEMITRRFSDDLIRGVVATDALIGTFTSLTDESMLANRCFLYHLVGRGTGEWHVPIGGMGALADALEKRARDLGVEFRTGLEVDSIEEDGRGVVVSGLNRRGGTVEYEGAYVLAAVAPSLVDRWRGRESVKPVGAQIKINMLLDRLPRLKSGVDAYTAFAGTTHLEEGYDQLEAAHALAVAGQVPQFLPSEVYCHSLSDPSILNGENAHTLTLFGLHTPSTNYESDHQAMKTKVASAALAALQQHLAEPLEDCLTRDDTGLLCVDIASPLDVGASVGMPGGNIFHADLSWPWLDDGESAETPAQQQGVTVDGSSRIMLAGAGSRRGGGVSGLGGFAAATAMEQMFTN